MEINRKRAEGRKKSWMGRRHGERVFVGIPFSQRRRHGWIEELDLELKPYIGKR
jgi:hypothetical protein